MRCKMYGRALYDYEARTTEELTIKEGMILLITDDSDPDWWDATLRVDSFEEGESGLVPVVYVEEATPIHMAKGLYDYDPNTSEEIKLREGDLVKVYEKVDNDWWFVKIENEVGLVPATYVEVEQESLPVPVGDGHKKDLSGEHQKMLLMGALDGLGFARKSESHAPTGMVYGPDDATYYPVLAVDKKKKKASEKGLLGVSLQDDTAYFLEPTTKEILFKFRLAEIKAYKEKKSKLVVDLESGECRDFEGEKADISLLFSIIDAKLNPKAAKASSPGNKKIVFSNDIPAPSIIGAPIMPPVIQQQTVKNSTREMRAVVVYDYDATNEEELTIKEDDRLIVLNDSDPDWTLVKLENSAVQGFVPRSYITFGRNQGTTNDSPQKPVNDSLTLSNAKPAVSAEDMEKAIKIAKEQERVKAEQERIRKLEDMREKARRDEELKQQSKDVQGPTRPAPTPVIPARPQRTPDPTHSPQPVIPARPKQITPIFQPASSSVPPRPTNAAPRPPSPNKAVDAAPPPMPPRPNAPVSKPSTEQLSAPKQSLAKPDASKLKKWTDTTGKFEVMAEYRGIADGKVELHKENGHTIFVPISKLSHDSKKFLQTISGNAVLKEQVQKVVPVIPATPIVSKTPKQNVAAENYSYNGFDWKAWLVKAGVSPYDASTYAAKFVQQNLDESILEDVDKETLRAMQISEGDIIRIRRATKLPKMTASVVETVQRNENVAELKNLERLYRDMSIKQQPVNTRNQIVEDEMLARRLQEEENSRGSVAARKVSQYSSVDAGKILEAGNILQAAKNPAKNATQGSASRQPTISSPVNPSNDPWTTFAGTSLPTKEQEAIKRQQQETAKTLETARMAMEKANEQLAKAKLLEEQSKANQSEMALKQAQETARAALLMQQQAAQKLMSAQMSAAYKPTQPVVALPPPLIPTNPAVQNYIQSTQIRPLVNPMLNQPVMGVSGMNPNMLGMGAQMQPGASISSHGGAQLQYMGQINTPSMVTSQGVQKPSWSQASPSQPFGNVQLDPYAALKQVNNTSPSVFTSSNSNSNLNAGLMSSASPMGSGSNLNQQGIGNVNSNPQGTMSMNLQMNAMKMGNNMMLGSTQFSTNFNPTMLPNTNQGFNQGMMMHGNQGILSQQQMGVATNTGMLGNQMNPNMINPNLLNNPQMNQGYLNTMGNMNNPHFNQQQNQGYRGN